MDEYQYEMAERLQRAQVEDAVKNIVRYTGPSLSECEECGESIPPARQLAAKGCTLCIDCASVLEVRHV